MNQVLVLRESLITDDFPIDISSSVYGDNVVNTDDSLREIDDFSIDFTPAPQEKDSVVPDSFETENYSNVDSYSNYNVDYLDVSLYEMRNYEMSSLNRTQYWRNQKAKTRR